MNTGMNKIHPNQVVFVSVMSVCFDISINLLYMELLDVRI